jgi:hypothetical protein
MSNEKEQRPEQPPMYSELTPENYANLAAASHNTSFRNIDGPSSSFPELDWGTYTCFRPGESVARTHRHIMTQCHSIYEECGIIANIVDLMTDFTWRGLSVGHPQKSRDKVYKAWAKQVDLPRIAERFCHYAFCLANIPIQRHWGDMTVYRSDGPRQAKVPVRYNFINPAIMSVKDKQLGAYTGNFEYVIDFRDEMMMSLSTKGVSDEAKTIDLNDKERFILNFYRKDDWKPFAKPFIYALIKEVSMLNKLDLAERTALDSAVNQIRIFKLGDIDSRLMPEAAAFQKLNDILQSNVGSGAINVLWGPDIELVESSSDFYKFLGYQKYEPTIQKIYQASGIPAQGSSTAHSNHLSLNIIMERLEYCRTMLNQFIRGELDIIQQALGDTKPAEIEYANTNFTDENAHRALLIQLADRNLISDELLQSYFHHNSVMENARISEDEKNRDKGKKVRKLGAFTEKDFEKSLQKTAMQLKLVETESLFDKYNIDDLTYTVEGMGGQPNEQNSRKEAGMPGQGRPKNSKDSEPRKTRTMKPTTNAQTQLWAVDVYNNITEFVKPFVLESTSKASIRELTSDEFKDYEEMRAHILFNMEIGKSGEEEIVKALEKPASAKLSIYKECLKDLSKELDRELTQNEKIIVQAFVFACK